MLCRPAPFLTRLYRVLCMPKLIEETGHMGAPCEPHERIVSVERYGRVYKRKVSAPHKIRGDAPAGSHLDAPR